MVNIAIDGPELRFPSPGQFLANFERVTFDVEIEHSRTSRDVIHVDITADCIIQHLSIPGHEMRLPHHLLLAVGFRYDVIKAKVSERIFDNQYDKRNMLLLFTSENWEG